MEPNPERHGSLFYAMRAGQYLVFALFISIIVAGFVSIAIRLQSEMLALESAYPASIEPPHRSPNTLSARKLDCQLQKPHRTYSLRDP
jgi:hypothetical protein